MVAVENKTTKQPNRPSKISIIDITFAKKYGGSDNCVLVTTKSRGEYGYALLLTPAKYLQGLTQIIGHVMGQEILFKAKDH